MRAIKAADEDARRQLKEIWEREKKLSPFIKKNSFDVSIRRKNQEDFCPALLTPIYPASLKRLHYFFPADYMFENKRWSGFFCDGSFRCDYIVTSIVENSANISMECNGDISINDITMNSTATFLIDKSIFQSIATDVSVKSKYVKSNWKFHQSLAQ